MTELKLSSNWTTAKWQTVYARQQAVYIAWEERFEKRLSLLKEQTWHCADERYTFLREAAHQAWQPANRGWLNRVERLMLLGGQLNIDSKLGQGTRLTAVISYHKTREEA